MRWRFFFLLLSLAALSWAQSAVVHSIEKTDSGSTLQPQLILENTDSTTITGFELRYWFTVDDNKTPLYDLYSPLNDSAGGTVTISLENLSGNLWVAHIYVTAVELDYGEQHYWGNGVQFGLHYSDYSDWDRTDDPSYLGPTYTSQINSAVQALDLSGNVLWGNAPSSSTSSSSVMESSSSSLMASSSSEVSSSSRIYASATSSTEECSNVEVFYDGTTYFNATFNPWDWPEAFESPANIGQVNGIAGLSVPVLRNAGAKAYDDDWISGYVLPEERDFTGAYFALSILSRNGDAVGHKDWGFRLVDANGLESGTLWYEMTVEGLNLRIASSSFSLPDSFELDHVSKVIFEIGDVAAQEYALNYFDNIRLECGEYDNRLSSSSTTTSSNSSSNGTVSSSSNTTSTTASSGSGTLLIQVSGNGTANPSGSLSLDSGENVSVTLTPNVGYALSGAYLDGSQVTVSDGVWTWTSDGDDHVLTAVFTTDTENSIPLIVTYGSHGSASLSGTYRVLSGDTYTIHFYPDYGYRMASVLVNGVSKGAVDSITVGPIYDSTAVYASFSAKTTHNLTLEVQGSGVAILPDSTEVRSGQSVTSYPDGENIFIILTADDGAQLKSVTVNGVSVAIGPRIMIGSIAADTKVVATFITQTEDCPVLVRSKHPTPDIYGRPAVMVSGNGNGLDSGWYYDYYVQLAEGDVMTISPWWLDGLNYENRDLGGGLWRVRYSSDSALGTSDSTQPIVGMSFSSYIYWYPSSEISATKEYDDTLRINENTPLYRADGTLLCGQIPSLLDYSVTPQLEVYYHDNSCSDNYIRPIISITNVGTVPVSNFYYLYIFHVKDGNIPVLSDWYTPDCQVSLWSLGNDYYAIRFDFYGVTLHPGETLPLGTGNSVGIFYSGWSTIDYSDDYSYMSSGCGSDSVLNPNIPVYDQYGNQIYGNTFDPNDETQIPQDTPTISGPNSLTVVEGSSVNFGVSISFSGNMQITWYRDGVAISGATGTSYSFSPATLSDDGAYFWVSIYANGQTYESAHALLSVVTKGMLPVITEQPEDRFRRTGQSVSFDVQAIDPMGGTLAYQWLLNGEDISGATDTVLSIDSVLLSQDGSVIQARVTNSQGSVLSDPAGLMVRNSVSNSKQVVLAGRLVESSQTDGVDDTTLSMTVRIYDQRKGGSVLYEEQFWNANDYGIPIKEARFSLSLGTGASENSLDSLEMKHETLYAEILVGVPSRQEIAGDRIPFTAVPYSKR